jgi:hypothetical protein
MAVQVSQIRQDCFEIFPEADPELKARPAVERRFLSGIDGSATRLLF